MQKLASATVFSNQAIDGPQLQRVRGGADPVVVVVPSPPSLKAERVQ